MSEVITLRQWLTVDGHGCVEVWNGDDAPFIQGHSWMSKGGDQSGLGGHLRDRIVAAMGLKPGDRIPVDMTLTVKRPFGPREFHVTGPHVGPHVDFYGVRMGCAASCVATFVFTEGWEREAKADAEEYAAKLNERDKKGGA